MDNQDELFVRACALKDSGEFGQAYNFFLHLARLDPLNDNYRILLGEICVKLNRSQDALRLYKHLAANLIQRGRVIQAISLNKRILEIDPQEREIQEQLSNLYVESMETPQMVQSATRLKEMAVAPMHFPQASPASESLKEYASIFDLASNLEIADSNLNVDLSISGHDNFYNLGPTFAAQEAAHLTLMGKEPPKILPPVPLFSDLPPKAFSQLMERCKRYSVPPEAVLVRQGDPGDSLFIISYGKLRVLRQVKDQVRMVTELGPGDFYGEFAYFSKRPREATLTSTTPSEILEITRSLMDEIILAHPKVERAMQNLYKERVLNNLLRESDLFSCLTDEERNAFAKRFSHMPVAKNQVIIREGDLADSFYVIQSGSVKVMKSGTPEPLAVLREGEFFGEYAMVTGAKRTASVMALEETQLVSMTKDLFRELLTQHPQVFEKVRRVAKDRAAQNLARTSPKA